MSPEDPKDDDQPSLADLRRRTSRSRRSNYACAYCCVEAVHSSGQRQRTTEVRGASSEEVARIVELLEHPDRLGSPSVVISGGTVGVLNTGQAQSIASIGTSSNRLQQAGQVEVSTALRALAEAVAASAALERESRNEILEQLAS